MGVGTRVKKKVGKCLSKVSEGVKSIGEKTGDAIAAVSQLSPAQIMEVDRRRTEYLAALPDCDGEHAQAYIARNLGAISIEVFHAYLPQISELYQPISEEAMVFRAENRIRYFDITQWVMDKEENSIDKLVNIYQALSDEECSIALIYARHTDGCAITLAVCNNQDTDDPTIANSLGKRLESAVLGNFPGAETTQMQNEIGRAHV